MVGNGRVGKTSLTHRVVFDQFEEQAARTKVVNSYSKAVHIENTQKWAQVQIWDTLGQDRFKSVAPAYFRRAVGAFLVYDISNMESFRALEEWYEQIQNSQEKVIIMLLGNKLDVANREVPYNEAMEYAMKNNFGFMEVSAKMGIGAKEALGRMVAGKVIYFVITSKI